MFKLILVATLLGLAAAVDDERGAEIRSLTNDPSDADGNFAYAFDTTNGIAVQESGNIAGVNGAAQWVSPEGVPVQLTYTADENGYHPVGDHLPTPPPIPEAILRAIEYIRTHPPKEENQYQPPQSPLRG
ncbi:pupal cuticle protein Edg-78E-like [Episyrphus balteatus]|uniref:pupal cuticle protein Edg-78E-like n=1 Tax=Episyrphus balteatus TaxID=286459 RepID=UPI002485F9E5|nr:pupal cuticle protein Edg-78E-like [Episyrphus balteatus]